jgi:hypothetical protein
MKRTRVLTVTLAAAAVACGLADAIWTAAGLGVIALLFEATASLSAFREERQARQAEDDARNPSSRFGSDRRADVGDQPELHREHPRHHPHARYAMTLVLRLLPAALCALAGIAGLALATQAGELLVDAFRLPAAVSVGVLAVALLVAAAGLVTARPGSAFVALGVAIAMIGLVVLGLRHMGSLSLQEAFVEAACIQGYGICFPQAAAVMRLCGAVIAGGLVFFAWRRLAARRAGPPAGLASATPK